MGGDAIDAMHLTDVDGPQECLAILDQTFVNPGLLWTRSAGSYLTFLLESADLRAAYEYHQRVLRLLQWGAAPQRWALKWPCHLLALDAIRSVYPDASFVVTHRDPVQALASNCSLAHMLRSSADPAADPRQTGRDMLELVRKHVDRLVDFDAAQSAAGRELVVHVDYYQLVDDPASRHARRLRSHRDRVDRRRRRNASGRGGQRTPKARGASTPTRWRSTASRATRSPTPSPPTPGASTYPASTTPPRLDR